jgi:hypothetical protein
MTKPKPRPRKPSRNPRTKTQTTQHADESVLIGNAIGALRDVYFGVALGEILAPLIRATLAGLYSLRPEWKDLK